MSRSQIRNVILAAIAVGVLGWGGWEKSRQQAMAAAVPVADQAWTSPAQDRGADDSSAVQPAALTFHGYACSDDCSGHEAGYNWAEQNSIDDPDDCPVDPNDSHSFTEGCWAYAGQNGPLEDPNDTNSGDDDP